VGIEMTKAEVIHTKDIVGIVHRVADILKENMEYLCELDTEVGDGDHGFNMAEGFARAKDRAVSYDGGDIGGLMKKIGFGLMKDISGSAGAIFGSFFLGQGKHHAKGEPGAESVSLSVFAAGLESALEEIKKVGRAEPGDCTMVDALLPAWKALDRAANEKEGLYAAFSKAEEAALNGAESTSGMIGKRGRAKNLGERSIGHLDAGAMSTYFIFKACAEYFKNQ
jgi:dihydroxyacetone kinase-like protein